MRKMKDSGIEWIGEIPENWEVYKIKNIAQVIRGGSPRPIDAFLTDDPNGYNWIKIGDTQKGNKYIYKTAQKIIADGLDKTRLVKRGTLLLTNSMSFGEAYILEIDGCIHDGWLAFSDYKKIQREFFYYCLISPLCEKQFGLQVAGGVVQNLNIDKVKSTFILLPSFEEQERISSFLDTQCAHIDSVIEKTKQSVEEYKKLKQAVITQAVTKGVRGEREMKDSGVEWIGEIPVEYSIRKARSIAKFFNGDRSKNYPSGDDLQDEGVPFITSNNLGQTELNMNITTNKFITEEKYNSMGGAKIRMNDIIFCLRGSVGKCSINHSIEKGTVASSLVVIRANNISARFLNYYLNASFILEQATLTAIGIGSLNLAAEDIAKVLVTIPPKEEQQEIAAFLDQKCAEIDTLITKKEQFLTELESYKKSLIYEYVTGKKEVAE